MEELGKGRPNVPARSAIRWRHISLNAARARGYGGDRSVPSRGGGRNFRSHKGPMVRKMGSGGRTGRETRKTVSDTRRAREGRAPACTTSRTEPQMLSGARSDRAVGVQDKISSARVLG